MSRERWVGLASLLALAALGCPPSPPPPTSGPPVTKKVVIELKPIGGQCLTSVEPVSVKARRGDFIHWTLHNACDNERTITLSFPPGESPLDPCPLSKLVPPAGEESLTCKVMATAVIGHHYKYSVAGGDVLLDPEIEILPPM